ncbi:MAG: hypothetical protein ACJAXN_003285, partial [Psychromonas sp.]
VGTAALIVLGRLQMSFSGGQNSYTVAYFAFIYAVVN